MTLGGRSRARRPPLPLLATACVGALVAVVPAIYLLDVAASHGVDDVFDELLQRRTLDLVTRSLALTATVTALCTALGLVAALAVNRTNIPFRRLWLIVLALPLAIPSYLAAYAWLSAKPSLAGFGGATLVLTLTSFPYVFLPVAAALTRLDPAQEEVARSLGASPAEVLWRVTLRQIRTAISAGALLVALYVLSDFGAVGTMRYEVFTWVIYGAYNAGFNPARAAILSFVLLAVALPLVAFELRTRGAASSVRVGGSVARRERAAQLERLRLPALAFVLGLAALALAFPVISVALWLQRGISGDAGISGIGPPLLASLRISIAAALLTTVIALPIGVLSARHGGRAVAVLERTTYVTHALPGIVIAISMVYVGVRTLPFIYQKTPLLVVSYAVLFLPLAVASVRSAMEQSSPAIEEVARSLGRRPLRAFVELTGRLAAPGLAAGIALVFLASMKELPATLLLHPTGMETLATELWQRTGVSDFAGAAPYAAALVVFAAVPTAVLGWWSGRLSDVATH